MVQLNLSVHHDRYDIADTNGKTDESDAEPEEIFSFSGFNIPPEQKKLGFDIFVKIGSLVRLF